MLGYTQAIDNEYWNYADRISAETRHKLENIDEKSTIAEWKNQLDEIGNSHTCSARFFLMSFIYEQCSDSCGESYTYNYKDKTYTFSNVTHEYSLSLPEAERNQYVELLSSIAADNHGNDVEQWKLLMWKAMFSNKKVGMLSREDGFAIAHGLQFDLRQTEKFLITALENDGFSYTDSDDIIEAFCFLYTPSNSITEARSLKDRYDELSKGVAKKTVELKPDEFTREIALSLPELVDSWSNNASKEDTVNSFMDWLVSQAPNLDLPGKSAYKLYKKLACYAYELTTCEDYDIYPEDFEDDIMENCVDSDDDPKDFDSYEVANTLCLFAENEFDNPNKKKSDLVWRYLSVDDNGKIVALAIGERIPNLLNGTESVDKADMLFMLWYTCGMFWRLGDNSDGQTIYNRFAGFYNLAETILDKAMLPGFYVPHLLERSFLNAILNQDLCDYYPFEVYELMCDVISEKKTRNRKTTVDAKSARKERLALRKEIEKKYVNGEIDLEGLGDKILPHFKSNAYINGQYVFTREGIFYNNSKASIKDPDEKVAITYDVASMADRFDMNASGYKAEETDRINYMYALSLFLADHSSDVFSDCDFRVNYKKNATLTIIKLKKKK